MKFFPKFKISLLTIISLSIISLSAGYYLIKDNVAKPQITKPEQADYTIFESSIGRSPVPPGKEYSPQITEIYKSGKLVTNDGEWELDKNTMTQIKRLISTIMGRRCSSPDHQPRDTHFSYTLRSGNKTKYLQYGACYRKELKKIEELVATKVKESTIQNPEAVEGKENILRGTLYYESSSYAPRNEQDIGGMVLTLYESGELVLGGRRQERYKLSEKDIDEIRSFIRGTGIMSKSCAEEPLAPDIYRQYMISLDGKEKWITFPSCMDLTDKISEFVWKYVPPQE